MTTDEITQSLKNIEKLLGILVRFQYSTILTQAINNELDGKIFDLTGVKSRNEICSELKISPNTLAETWSKWLELGILVKQGNSYKKTIE